MKKLVIPAAAVILGLSLLTGLGFYSGERFSKTSQTSQAMQLHSAPKLLPEIQFQDAEGRRLTLEDFRGKVVLLNIWATWCAPCRHEMPTLDRLQGKLGGKEFEVVALSIDRAGPDAVRKFFSEISVKHLSLYIDESTKSASLLKAFGLPVTLLLNREGREITRLVGPAEWDTPEMITFFKTVIERPRISQSKSTQKVTQHSQLQAKRLKR